MIKREQIWADVDFVKALKRIQGRKLMQGKKYEGLEKITRELAKSPLFLQIEKELANMEKSFMRLEK